jgi:hypothetical protein
MMLMVDHHQVVINLSFFCHFLVLLCPCPVNTTQCKVELVATFCIDGGSTLKEAHSGPVWLEVLESRLVCLDQTYIRFWTSRVRMDCIEVRDPKRPLFGLLVCWWCWLERQLAQNVVESGDNNKGSFVWAGKHCLEWILPRLLCKFI